VLTFLSDIHPSNLAEYRLLIPRAGTKQSVVAVKSFLRKGKLVRGFKRKQLLALADALPTNTRSGKQAINLIKDTIATGQVPNKKKFLTTLGEVGKDFVKNPVRATREGFAREKLARQLIKESTGYDATKLAVSRTAAKRTTQAAKQYVKNNPEKVQELLVNTAGVAGSAVGGSIAGPVGKLGGDLVGALAARKGLTDFEALQKAKKILSNDEAFKRAGFFGKLKQTYGMTLKQLKDNAKEIEDNFTGDSAGWAVGNAAAEALDPVISAPLKGAAVAIPVVPKLVKAKNRIKAGENARLVARETAKEIGAIPKQAAQSVRRTIRAGNLREQRMRNRLNRKLKQLLED
jgi:hypothetical protein